MNSITTKLPNEYGVSHTIHEFCNCKNSGGVGLIIMSTPENIEVDVNQGTGEFTGIPIDLTKPWSFDYKVVCKKDTCSQCPNVEESMGSYTGDAVCDNCFPSSEINLYPNEDLPAETEIVYPDINCEDVKLPYSVRNEYYNGYIVLTLNTDCTWGDPFIRDFTGNPILTPNI